MCSICSYIIYSYSIVICSDEASSFLSWQPSSIQSTQGFSGNTHINERRVLKPPDIYKIAKNAKSIFGNFVNIRRLSGFCVTSLYFPNCPPKRFPNKGNTYVVQTKVSCEGGKIMPSNMFDSAYTLTFLDSKFHESYV